MLIRRKSAFNTPLCWGCIGILACLASGSVAQEKAQSAALPSEATVAISPLPASTLGPDLASASSTDVVGRMLADLAIARSSAATLGSYTATLEMQEEVGDTLRPLDRVQIKVRRQPFSVYMHWSDTGQEVLFADGSNDNRLLVKPTKGLAVFKRLWRLDPNCRMAKQNCRYPITDSGIENLVARIQEFYALRDDWSSVAECTVADAMVADSNVSAYEIRFRDRAISPTYFGSRFCFEKATGLLIAVDNFGWSDAAEPRLLEHYLYHSISTAQALQDKDFDETNPEYGFVVSENIHEN